MPRKSSKRRGRGKKEEEEEPEEEEQEHEEEEQEAEHAETDEDEYESEEEEENEEENDDDGRRSSRRGGRGGGGSRNRSRSSKKKKSGGRKKVALMSESGQTDEDRRLLRRKMREFQQEIVGEKGERIEDPSKVADFQEVRGTSNRLWENVKFTREAVLDADNFDIIATRAGRQADRLIQVPRYDATRFCSALRTKLASSAGGSGGEYFDWLKLGKAAGACYCAVPSRVSFLNGPVEVEYVVKERKKPERRRRAVEEEEGEEERPDDVEQKKADTSGDKLSAVERNIDIVSKTLGKRCKDELIASQERAEKQIEEKGDEMDEDMKRKARKRARRHGADVDAVKYLFNPKSFTQTVENIFHFSFLVKKGSAGISVRSDEEAKKYGGAGPGPVVRAMTNPNEAPTPKQAIVSLTMQDWRDMCEAYSVKEGDIPHRNVSRRRGGGGGTAQSSQK